MSKPEANPKKYIEKYVGYGIYETRRGVPLLATLNFVVMSSTKPTDSASLRQPPSLPTSPLSKRPKIMTTDDSEPSDGLAVPPLSVSPPLLIKKVSPTARTPTRGSPFSAGYDLYASEASKIPPRGRGLVGTGLQMAISAGCCEC